MYIDPTFFTLSRSLTYWSDFKLHIDPKFGVKDLAKRQLLDAMYMFASNIPDDEFQMDDPSGLLRYQVNQLTNGFIQEYGMMGYFSRNMPRGEEIFGPIMW